jgi:hypothetical protein
LHPNKIPPNVHIAKEGEPVRALGAFIGNGVDDDSVWTPTLDKIEEVLKRWAKSHPTFEGKRLIVNMEVGGRTQFRTRVQGMPANVLKQLNRMVQDFVWGNGTPHVSKDTLQLDFSEGGIKLLDIEA